MLDRETVWHCIIYFSFTTWIKEYLPKFPDGGIDFIKKITCLFSRLKSYNSLAKKEGFYSLMNLIKRWLSYLVMWGHLKCISLMSYCCRCWSDHSAYEKCFNIKNSVIMIFLELFITFMNFLHTTAALALTTI